MSLPRWLKRVFTHFQAPYQEQYHLPAYSANQLAHAQHLSGHRVAKPVFLAAGARPITIVIPACELLDLDRAREILGIPELRLASEIEIANWFKGCPPGCVPPVRIRSDQVMLMDRSLAHLGSILFAAGSYEMAVSMPFRAWYKMVRPGVGRFTMSANNQYPKRPLILVIEDEADTNHLLCQLLEQQGYNCRGAEDGRQALDLARELCPAAILLDLMLPDMNGFDLYERMRRFGPIKLPPALVVTALDDEAMQQRGRELGADAYLTKPFFPASLVKELHEVLADARA